MSLTVQFYTMLSMAATGVYIGAAIDTYSRFSKKRHSFHWLVACNDIVFWFIQALIVFFVLLQANYGEIRFYIFVALLCGYAAYQALFQTIYRKVLEWIISFVVYVYRFFVKVISNLLLKPFVYVLKLIYTLCIMIVTGILAMIMFVLRVVWKTLCWVCFPLLKWTGLHKGGKRIFLFFHKIKDFLSSIWKRKE